MALGIPLESVLHVTSSFLSRIAKKELRRGKIKKRECLGAIITELLDTALGFRPLVSANVNEDPDSVVMS